MFAVVVVLVVVVVAIVVAVAVAPLTLLVISIILVFVIVMVVLAVIAEVVMIPVEGVVLFDTKVQIAVMEVVVAIVIVVVVVRVLTGPRSSIWFKKVSASTLHPLRGHAMHPSVPTLPGTPLFSQAPVRGMSPPGVSGVFTGKLLGERRLLGRTPFQCLRNMLDRSTSQEVTGLRNGNTSCLGRGRQQRLLNHAARPLHCACMAPFAHRVHVHAFMGPQLDMMAWQSSQHMVSVDLAAVAWSGARPNVRLMRCRKQDRALRHVVVGGIYYVLMDKPGTMYCAGTKWRFTDLPTGW